jgi:hypothetical protein
MSIGLQIRHGSPHWWESPDIWVAPGQNPNGPPGSVGHTAFLWARVWVDQDVQGVQLDFWVANPAMEIRKTTANHIGTRRLTETGIGVCPCEFGLAQV